jgi:hypothetical protein
MGFEKSIDTPDFGRTFELWIKQLKEVAASLPDAVEAQE